MKCCSRLVTEEELSEVYGVTDIEGRQQLMHLVELAREYESDMEFSVSIISFYLFI